jgi:hypothetical protein
MSRYAVAGADIAYYGQTPLATLASQLPYKLEQIGSLTHEDPSLILLFSQLRSKSLQTLKGAVAIPGSVEFNVSWALDFPFWPR